MKRSLMIFAALGVLALTSSSMSQASQRVVRKASTHSIRVASSTTCSVKPAGGCTAGCPLCPSSKGASIKTSVATGTMKPANAGGVCPVGDPSECPSSCSRAGASSAVTTAVR